MPIYSLPSLRQPESISPQFYFTSQSFIDRAQTDIDSLLSAWITSAKSNQQQHQLKHHHHPLPNSNQKRLGPFLKFKSIYSRLGWIYIHLSVVDPALRRHWFNTLIRLFLNNLKEDVEPLRQIGTLFGLWCFWGTQPDSVLGPKHYIILDPDMLDYLKRIPSKFSNQLDQYFNSSIDECFDESKPSNTPGQSNLSTNHSFPTSSLSIKHRVHLDPNIFGPPPPTIKPSDSLHQVLKNLIDQDAFLIQPSEIALVYPPLPTNRVTFENPHSDSRQDLPDPERHQSADHLQTTTIKPQPTQNVTPSSTVIPELIISTRSELVKWQKAQQNSLCNPALLNQLRDSYLSTKSFLSDQSPSSAFTTTDQVTTEPDPLTREIFSEAIGMTRKVIQKTGPGLDHLLFPNDPPPPPPTDDRDSSNHHPEHQNSLEAFLLVDQAKSIPDLEKLMKI